MRRAVGLFIAVSLLPGCETKDPTPEPRTAPKVEAKRKAPTAKAAKGGASAAIAKTGGEPLWRALRRGDVDALKKGLKERKLTLPRNARELLPEGKDWVFVALKYRQLRRGLLPTHVLPSSCVSSRKYLSGLVAKVKSKARALLDKKVALKALAQAVPKLAHGAALVCQPKVVEAFVKTPAQANATDAFGLTPLHYASCGAVARALIARGAKVDSKSSHGLTPLHVAINVEVAKALVESKANIEALDSCHNTPLHRAPGNGAIYAGYVRFAQDSGKLAAFVAKLSGARKKKTGLLTDRRKVEASPRLRWLQRLASKSGRTIVQKLVVLAALTDVTGYLVHKGANTSAKNKHGRTPAQERSHRSSSWDD